MKSSDTSTTKSTKEIATGLKDSPYNPPNPLKKNCKEKSNLRVQPRKLVRQYEKRFPGRARKVDDLPPVDVDRTLHSHWISSEKMSVHVKYKSGLSRSFPVENITHQTDLDELYARVKKSPVRKDLTRLTKGLELI